MGFLSKLFGSKDSTEKKISQVREPAGEAVGSSGSISVKQAKPEKVKPVKFQLGKNVTITTNAAYFPELFPIRRPGQEKEEERVLIYKPLFSKELKEELFDRCIKQDPKLVQALTELDSFRGGRFRNGEEDLYDAISVQFRVTASVEDINKAYHCLHSMSFDKNGMHTETYYPPQKYSLVFHPNAGWNFERAMVTGKMPTYLEVPLSEAEMDNLKKEIEAGCKKENRPIDFEKDVASKYMTRRCNESTVFSGLKFEPPLRGTRGRNGLCFYVSTENNSLVQAMQKLLEYAKREKHDRRFESFDIAKAEELLEMAQCDDCTACFEMSAFQYESKSTSLALESKSKGLRVWTNFDFNPELENYLVYAAETSMGKTRQEAAYELFSTLTEQDKKLMFGDELEKVINYNPGMSYDEARRRVCEQHPEFIYPGLLEDMKISEEGTAKANAAEERARAALKEALGQTNKPEVPKRKQSYFTKD